MCVLPSCVEGSFVPHRFRARAFAKRVPLRPRPGTPCDFERCTRVWSPCSTTRATVSCHNPRRPRRGHCAPNRRMRGDADRSLDALRFAHLSEEIRACLACGTCRADPLAGCPPDRKSVHPNAGLTLIRGSRGGFMRRVAGVIACAVVVLLLLPSRLAAQSGIIWGRVADTTGALLARATVSVEATGGRTTSNDQGNYEIRRVPAGTHTVRVRLLGYVAQTVRIAVSEEQTVRQDFLLRRQPIGLAPVDLVVGSRAR